jgi:hypothetical protein
VVVPYSRHTYLFFVYISLYPSLLQSNSLSLCYLTYVERADLHIQGELGQIHAAGGRDRQPLRVGDPTVRSDPYEAVGNSHLIQSKQTNSNSGARSKINTSALQKILQKWVILEILNQLSFKKFSHLKKTRNTSSSGPYTIKKRLATFPPPGREYR